jgi:hypothetical protein
MRNRFSSLLAILLLLILATSGTSQDANTTVTTTVSCCSIRVERESVTVEGANGGAIVLATILVRWYDGSNAVVREETVNITDGDPALAADDFLTGTGAGGTPLGYIRAVGETQAGESGSVAKRWRYRRLLWLKTNARLSNNAITLQ